MRDALVNSANHGGPMAAECCEADRHSLILQGLIYLINPWQLLNHQFLGVPVPVVWPPFSGRNWQTSKKPSHRHQAVCFGRRRRMKSHKKLLGPSESWEHPNTRVPEFWPVHGSQFNLFVLKIHRNSKYPTGCFKFLKIFSVTGWRFPKYWCLQDRGTPESPLWFLF